MNSDHSTDNAGAGSRGYRPRDKRLPTSTATPARVRLFLPTQRPTYRKGDWLETNWGRCRVTGKLGQRHADVLDSLLSTAEKRRTLDDGGVALLVDPAKIRRTLSDKGHSQASILAWLDDLVSAVIEIETPKVHATGHLLDHVTRSKQTFPNPLGGERHLWLIRLGVPLVQLLKLDRPLYYDPAPLARLTHGLSQAVARHVLTHTKPPVGGWDLDTLILTVSGELSSQAIRDARRYLREDAPGLAKLGIEVNSSRIHSSVGQTPDETMWRGTNA